MLGSEQRRLGDGTTYSSDTPIDVSGLTSGVQAGAVGGYHVCALMTSGKMKCWGDNFTGQLGDGTTIERHTPVDVVGFNGGANSPPLIPTSTLSSQTVSS